MNYKNKLALCLTLGMGMATFYGCAKEEDRLSPDTNNTGVEAVEEESFQQHNVSLTVGLDEEELRLLVGEYVDRQGGDNTQKYPKFRIYNTVETFRGSNDPTRALPENIKRFFPGKQTYGEVTQADIDKAPYNMGATFVGGNRHAGSIIVYNPSIGPSSAAASPISLQARLTSDGREVLTYRGAVNFNKGIDVLAQGPKHDWHAMVFTGTRKEGRPSESSLPADHKGKGVLWRVYMGTRLGDNTWDENGPASQVTDSSFEVTTTNNYHGSFLSNLPAVPLASNWSKLTIEGVSTGTNDPDEDDIVDMKLKMQGAIIQYDVTANVSDQLDIRRWGIISNTIDVQGSYLLTPENIKEAFDQKDTEAYGVPGWRPEEPNYTPSTSSPAAFFLYRRNGIDPTRINSAAYSFPWDLPALHTPYTTAQSKAPAITAVHEAQIENALYAFRRYFPAPLPAAGNNNYNPARLLTNDGRDSKTLPAHGGTVISGTSRSPRTDNQNFQRFLFWGMPRKQQPKVPATYFFADVHNGRFLYQSHTATNSLNGEELRAMQQDNYAVQKSLVLHQTNGRFRVGRISHIHTSIESDLLISEVAQDVRGDKNYVAIEFTNPSFRVIDLSHYALVRLVPKSNGSTTSYEYYVSDGVSTTDIKEATILPLGLAGDPYGITPAYANFTDWSTKKPITVSRNDNLRRYYTSDRYGTSLDFQRILIVGSGAFVDDTNGNNHPFIFAGRKSATESALNVTRKMISYKGTILDLKKDEQPAFALIRYYDSGRGYRIIDATGPIPTHSDYSEGVSEAYPLNNSNSPYLRAWESIKGKSYTIQRKPGVNFPSIFPYRTDLNFTDLWTVSELTDLTYGKESEIASIGYRSNGEKRLDGTQGNPKSSANINSIIFPVKRDAHYSSDNRTPAYDYTWWNTRYFPNIPEPTKY